MRLPSKPTILMGRNHWSRCVGLTLSSIDRTASPQSSCMFYSQRPSRKKISNHECLDTRIPNMPTAVSKDARPGLHEPAKPGGDVGGRLLLPTSPRSGKTKNAFPFDAQESVEIADFSSRSQTQQLPEKIRILRPSNGDSWEKFATSETKSRRPWNPQASSAKVRANGHGMGSGAFA